jgi:hypothetical protein
MKVYIIMEHPDSMGSTPHKLADIVHAVFFDQRRAEDFIRGMASYINSYEGRELLLNNGKATDKSDTIHFQIIEKDAL